MTAKRLSSSVFDDTNEYILDWLTRESAQMTHASASDQLVVESHEKKFDSLIDELLREGKKMHLYKPRTSR